MDDKCKHSVVVRVEGLGLVTDAFYVQCSECKTYGLTDIPFGTPEELDIIWFPEGEVK